MCLALTMSACNTLNQSKTYGYKSYDPCIRCGEGWTFLPNTPSRDQNMKKIASLILLAALVSGCQTTSQGITIQMKKDDNTKSKNYSYIKDPTGSAPSDRVHSFEIGSECGDLK